MGPHTAARLVPAIRAQSKEVMTIHDVAEYLGVSTRTVYSITAPRGTLRCIRCGPRGVRYTLASLEKFIREQESDQQT
jgi:excisionase family DNA binding protein